MTKKKKEERKARVRSMIRILKKLFPEPKTALSYKTNWELYVAVVLSAQCTDKRVNEVTKELFKKYKKFEDYVRAGDSTAGAQTFAREIKPTGFYKNKAKNILSAARMVKERFCGHMPETMDELLMLPGVGRKTANVILGSAFGVVEGIAVDTHVRRFARRFDLSDFTDPVRIERDLMEIVPKKDWFFFTHWLIEYGREYCPACRHECAKHPLTKIYPVAASKWPLSK